MSENEILKKASDTEEGSAVDDTIRILVVDDKPNIIKQLSEMFAKSEWVVEGAADEATALQACESSSFSAILISMGLPNDGAIGLAAN